MNKKDLDNLKKQKTITGGKGWNDQTDCVMLLFHSITNNSVISGFEIITCREFNDYHGGTIIQEVKTAEDFLDTDEFGLDEPFYRIFAV